MRLSVPEGDEEIRSSIHRNRAISKHKPPKDMQDIINILSDQTDNVLPVYRESGENSKTIATGKQLFLMINEIIFALCQSLCFRDF